ncbi:hypothetical protein ARUE_c20400 [Arthrobacter sp. Rue61a]|nr:hypothetical protein ARUE_c20400 [Arthrobacter sp. Rue61a]
MELRGILSSGSFPRGQMALEERRVAIRIAQSRRPGINAAETAWTPSIYRQLAADNPAVHEPGLEWDSGPGKTAKRRTCGISGRPVGVRPSPGQ